MKLLKLSVFKALIRKNLKLIILLFIQTYIQENYFHQLPQE